MIRTGKAIWKGDTKTGGGTLKTPSGVLDQTPYTYKARFTDQDPKEVTNPEELIASAHAGCFAMALANLLSEGAYTVKQLDVKCTIDMENKSSGPEISKSHLDLEAKIPDIHIKEFQDMVEDAKNNCPVSKVLSCEVTYLAHLDK